MPENRSLRDMWAKLNWKTDPESTNETPEEREAREAREAARMAELDARWEKVKKNRERRQKIAKALTEEEKRTSLPVPFTLKMRYGLIHVMPENDGDLEKYAEEDKKLPEMAYYEKFAENLEEKLKQENP